MTHSSDTDSRRIPHRRHGRGGSERKQAALQKLANARRERDQEISEATARANERFWRQVAHVLDTQPVSQDEVCRATGYSSRESIRTNTTRFRSTDR